MNQSGSRRTRAMSKLMTPSVARAGLMISASAAISSSLLSGFELILKRRMTMVVSYRVSDERPGDRRLERRGQTMAADRHQTGGDLPIGLVGVHEDSGARPDDGRGARHERHDRRRRASEDVPLSAVVGHPQLLDRALCRRARDVAVGHGAVDAGGALTSADRGHVAV